MGKRRLTQDGGRFVGGGSSKANQVEPSSCAWHSWQPKCSHEPWWVLFIPGYFQPSANPPRSFSDSSGGCLSKDCKRLSVGESIWGLGDRSSGLKVVYAQGLRALAASLQILPGIPQCPSPLLAGKVYYSGVNIGLF